MGDPEESLPEYTYLWNALLMNMVWLDINLQMCRISGFNPSSIIPLLNSMDKLFNLSDSDALSEKW